jgi:hypothetical protein
VTVSRPALLAVMTVACVCPARAAQAITLEIPIVTLKNTSAIRFTARPTTDSVPPGDVASARPVDTNDQAFRVRVPLRAIPWSDGCLCFGYTFIVERASGGTTIFDVRATPAGAFNETVTDVPFEVVDGNTRHAGVVSLPVASYRSESPILVLEPGDPDATGRVRMSGQQFLEFRIRNTSDRFGVTAMLNPDHARLEAPDLFAPDPRIDGPQTALLKPLEVRTVRVAVTPRPLSAISACLLPSKAKRADGTVKLSFDYQVGPFSGDRPSFFSESIGFRFEPNFYWLLLTLTMGVGLGVVLRALSARSWSSLAYLRTVAIAFLCALAMDLIAMLLSSSGSSLVLFNYSINPSQLLPVAAIGLVCGLNGTAVLKWIVNTFQPPKAQDPQGVH